VIVLFTDFGLQGPYTGQMKAVLWRMAPGIPAVDLFADAPVGNPKASAYLLAAYAEWFAAGTVFLAVVDPGVGGTRPPIILEADGRWYVGLATAYSSWLSAVPQANAAGTSTGGPSAHRLQPC
jgi:S-adenosylmethionine hydrolase